MFVDMSLISLRRSVAVLGGNKAVSLRLCRTEVPEGFKEIKRVSSLRIDAIASAGLGISRRAMWELCLKGKVMQNGEKIKKKSASVDEGDVIDVDYLKKNSDSEGGSPIGRVVVQEINDRSKSGRHHVVLLRHKCYVEQ